MNPINYPALQERVKTLIQYSLGGYPVVVRNLANATVSTYAVFSNGEAKNIDNRQNPTWTTGETAREAIIPGIDFYNTNTNTMTTPQVGGSVEWSVGGVSYKKRIQSVQIIMPVPNIPIQFVLGVL